MPDDPRAGSARERPRARKPTPAERRAERATIDDPAVVLEAAARFLEARPRSIAEVRRKLARLGYQAELVSGTVDRLVQLGYLDDEAFATTWVESRDRSRPRGAHALRRELELKGVDRAFIDAVLERRQNEPASGEPGAPDEGWRDPDDAGAERLLRRKLPAILREPDPRRRRQRAYALLARSGFGPDVCSSVTRRVLDAAAATGDAEDEDGGIGA